MSTDSSELGAKAETRGRYVQQGNVDGGEAVSWGSDRFNVGVQKRRC